MASQAYDCSPPRGQGGPRLLGSADVIAFAETASPRAPSELVLPRIQRVRGVEATDSRIVLDV
jgi:hypothetical protein